jgi:hypothetical protein
MSPRNEPLLWLQLVAIGAIPLELQLLRLILAGSDLGPVPSVERLLCWGIAVVAPAVLLWKRPVDWGSLLLVRQPLKGRTSWQRKISQFQENLLLKLVGAAGAVLLLAVFWSIDRSSLLIADLSPFNSGYRLQCLLIATPLLAIIFWQWNQLVNAIWLLTRPSTAIEGAIALSDRQLKDARCSFGLNLLRLETLDWHTPDRKTPAVEEPKERQKTIETPPAPEPSMEAEEEELSDHDSNALNGPNAEELNLPSAPDSGLSRAIEPEQAAEQNDSADLDPQVTEDNSVSSGDPEGHDEQTKPAGSEESDPEQAP